jgi:type II secretory pathway component PulF
VYSAWGRLLSELYKKIEVFAPSLQLSAPCVLLAINNTTRMFYLVLLLITLVVTLIILLTYVERETKISRGLTNFILRLPLNPLPCPPKIENLANLPRNGK